MAKEHQKIERAWRPGESAVWAGKRVLIVDVHGWPVSRVDLRWTEGEDSGHKRGVPAGQLSLDTSPSWAKPLRR